LSSDHAGGIYEAKKKGVLQDMEQTWIRATPKVNFGNRHA